MKIQLTLRLSDGHVLEDKILIEEHKLGDLNDEEIEAAIETNIRSWVDKNLSVEWETED